MKFNPRFFVREALKNVRLNLLMSITAVTTTFICILVLGAAILISAHVSSLISSVRQDVTISAFFPQDASQKKMDSVRNSVENYPQVGSVKFVSKQQAYENFKKRFKDNPQVYQDLGSDFLPASLEIKLKDPKDAGVVARKLESEGFAPKDLSYPQQTINRLNRVTDYIVWGLRGATALFLAASVLLISNTIRLSIFARRKEIEVMKLVGASDSFVRTPFVIEGLVQGLVGAVIAAIAVIWANSLFVEWAHNALPFFPISGSDVSILYVLAVLVGLGAMIGVLGSYLSVRRFLRV